MAFCQFQSATKKRFFCQTSKEDFGTFAISKTFNAARVGFHCTARNGSIYGKEHSKQQVLLSANLRWGSKYFRLLLAIQSGNGTSSHEYFDYVKQRAQSTFGDGSIYSSINSENSETEANHTGPGNFRTIRSTEQKFRGVIFFLSRYTLFWKFRKNRHFLLVLSVPFKCSGYRQCPSIVLHIFEQPLRSRTSQARDGRLCLTGGSESIGVDYVEVSGIFFFFLFSASYACNKFASHSTGKKTPTIFF